MRQHASARSAVDDDGVGVRPADLVAGGPAHAGIVGRRETIGMYGGTFAIAPRPSGGTRVSFPLPTP